MSTDRYIPGVPCWVDTAHPDPVAAAAFYAELFGWETEDTMPPGSADPYIIGRIRGEDVGAIGPVQAGAPAAARWNTYVWVDSADHAVAAAGAAGGTVMMAPFDVGDGGRMAVFADPEGAVIAVWEAREHRGAQVVNEAGSVVFNVLHTRDLESARAFYGAVFGWEVVDIDGAPMWALPGYGKFLDTLNPGMLDGMAEMNAPTGFENVVASIGLIDPDDSETPAHWSVTFAVDDAEATAGRAVELGGRVIADAVSAPWVRFAVLADPQGAVFTASQFVPETGNAA